MMEKVITILESRGYGTRYDESSGWVYVYDSSGKTKLGYVRKGISRGTYVWDTYSYAGGRSKRVMKEGEKIGKLVKFAGI